MKILVKKSDHLISGLTANHVVRACGWVGDADLNGSEMIALVGQSVRLPGGSSLLACPIDSGLQKAHAIATA